MPKLNERAVVNTLILVHTKALLDQWRTKLEEFLDLELPHKEPAKGRGRRKKQRKFGALSSNENSLTGLVDVALIQSCMTDGEIKPLLRAYGMVIVDECHHVSAVNFERVLKEITASRVYGLTATPIRKDGHQPIIFMQCGPIRYTADSKAQMATQNFQRCLIPRFTTFRHLSDDKRSFSHIVRDISEDDIRNHLLVKDISEALSLGRNPIILTSLTGHVQTLAELLKPVASNIITLVGSDSTKQKREIMEKLSSINPDERFVVIATGKYVGEGFDFPRLDTLFLVMPVSWKGLIAQYAGRLHRDYPGKTDVRIYDYVDLHVPVCESMYRKRLNGYKAIGYSVSTVEDNLFSEIRMDSIYDAEKFERSFHADLSKAKKSGLIACRKAAWKRPPKTLELLNALTLRGVEVTIVLSDTGYSENDIENYGITLKLSKNPNPNSVIIDRTKIWYGSTNFLGRSLPDTTAIRLEDTEIAHDIINSIIQNTRPNNNPHLILSANRIHSSACSNSSLLR